MTGKDTILLTDPDFETATHWYHPYGLELIKQYAEEHGFDVVHLHKEEDIIRRFNSAVHENDAILVTGNGHGNATTYTGYEMTELMKRGRPDTEGVAEGRHFVLLSCLIGKQLLPWLVEQGAVAAQGYEDKFVFVVDRDNYPDSYAKWFFQAHCAIERALIEGKTHGEARQRAIDLFTKYMNSDKVPRKCKPYLKHDRDCLILAGDPDARITEGEEPPTYTWEADLTPKPPKKEYRIKHVVTDEKTGEPVGQAEVKVSIGDVSKTAKTGGDGVAVMTFKTAGTAERTINHPDYKPYSDSKEFPPE